MNVDVLRLIVAMLHCLQVTCDLQKDVKFEECQMSTNNSSEENHSKMSVVRHIDSILSCTQLCGLKKSCVSVWYDQTHQVCQLHNTTDVNRPAEYQSVARCYEVRERKLKIRKFDL